jgi:hypothetical protein
VRTAACAVVLLLLAGCKRPEPDLKGSLARASTFLAAFPPEQLRFDAAIGLASIRERTDSEALQRAYRNARTVADRDADNPMRRIWDKSARHSVESVSRWQVPAAGTRVNPNRVVEEALFCPENGLRPETLAYIAGPMRDEGGYHSAHGLWALAIARDQGCLDGPTFASAATPLIAEIRKNQPDQPGPATLDVDLFGERILMLLLAGDQDPRIDRWIAALISRQQSDGGWGTEAPGQDRYYRYHATLVAAWALSRR